MNRILMVFLMAAGAAMAQDGRQIMQEVQKRQHSTSMRYEGTLQTVPVGTTNAKHIVTRHWVFQRLGDFGNAKTMIRFTSPPDMKGVAMLIVNHPTMASDEWTWRPNAAHEQRVPIGDRGDRFFGTDFSYEDLEERDVDQFDYTLTGEAGGQWRIDAKPRKASEYTHSYIFIDKTNYVYNRIETYNKKGPVKAIEFRDYKMVQGIWTPTAALIADGISRSRTVLAYEKVEYNLPLKEEDFTVEALRR